jgi:hypothetical protein
MPAPSRRSFAASQSDLNDRFALTRDRASIITKDVASVEEIVHRLEELEKRVVTVEEMRVAAERDRDEYRTLYLETMERCRKLELGLLSSKSERLPDGGAQLSLDVLSLVLNERQQAQCGFREI